MIEQDLGADVARAVARQLVVYPGQSPAKAVENLRVEAARLMMKQSRHPPTSLPGKRVLPIAIACDALSCVSSDSRHG